VPANPITQLKITAKTIGSLIRGNALAPWSQKLRQRVIEKRTHKTHLIWGNSPFWVRLVVEE
jgi:hypothetical protein